MGDPASDTRARPVVALVGLPDTQQLFVALEASLEGPAANILTAESPQHLLSAVRTSRSRTQGGSPHSYEGILEAAWLDHQTGGHPAVIAVLLRHGDVVGDPRAWSVVAEMLGEAKAAARELEAALVLVVSMPCGAGALPEDRLGMLRRQAGIDSRHGRVIMAILGLEQGDQVSMQRVLTSLVDVARATYLTAIGRFMAVLHHKQPPGPARAAGLAFKLGVLHELIGDSEAAAQSYDEALMFVTKSIVEPPNVAQRFMELHAVSKLVLFRLIGVLPADPARHDTVLRLFQKHLALFGSFPAAHANT